ncbi:MAG: RHS repeat-associated core domain-containing protein, partial [Candidatus Omnitrophica bacterium]|nr:RHS repeat-associated core domain-containing protein [Candidatus Omnitrophota bacterium]
ARYYDPKIGRFITADPLGMVNGPNLYTYCLNDPINWIDPWGLCVEVGFKWMPKSLIIFHTGIRVTSSEYGVRSWGFHPQKYALNIFSGGPVPGKISINESYDFYIPISSDSGYAKRLYQHLLNEENSPPEYYDFYLGNVNNCYTWRNKQLREVNITVRSN